MKTLTLPESEIITLADAAKEHGTVALAKMIGVGKSQLYRILRGHNRVTPETADKINAWLNADVPKPEEPLKSEQRRTYPTKSELIAALHNPRIYTLPSKPAIDWNDPKFLRLAAVEVAAAILQGRLKNVTIVLGGACKCGD